MGRAEVVEAGGEQATVDATPEGYASTVTHHVYVISCDCIHLGQSRRIVEEKVTFPSFPKLDCPASTSDET